ncbi:MAG: SH3 domain-containing protein, partial [Clostridia bacterium]
SREMTDAMSAAETEDAIIYYVNKPRNSSVALYFEDNEDSDEICRIPGGEPVEVQSFAENGFIKVVYGSDIGFVKSTAITPDKPGENTGANKTDSDNDKKDANEDKNSDEEEEKKAPVEAISANDTLFVITGVNLRPEPTTECEIIDTIPAGAEVTYLGEMEHGFYKVEYNGTVGYAYSDYLQK